MTETSPNVLIVDDEPGITRVLESSLLANGFTVRKAETGASALMQISDGPPDVIILDLGLMDMDGKDVIHSLREWSDLPVIVLSARHDEAERIAALDYGADDYVTKPFHMGELQARLRAALRRRQHRGLDTPTFSSNGLEIHFGLRRVTIDGDEVKLTRREYDLLRALALAAGQVVTHKHLLSQVWGGINNDPQLVRVYIGQLREKIEEDSSAPKIILTEQGVGYRIAFDEETIGRS